MKMARHVTKDSSHARSEDENDKVGTGGSCFDGRKERGCQRIANDQHWQLLPAVADGCAIPSENDTNPVERRISLMKTMGQAAWTRFRATTAREVTCEIFVSQAAHPQAANALSIAATQVSVSTTHALEGNKFSTVSTSVEDKKE